MRGRLALAALALGFVALFGVLLVYREEDSLLFTDWIFSVVGTDSQVFDQDGNDSDKRRNQTSDESGTHEPSPAAVSAAPTTKPPRNHLLDKWVDANHRKSLLVVQADNRRIKPGQRFSESYVHSSVVAFDYWAKRHNYSHLWVTEFSEGPYGRKIAGYWNKVPASMIGLRLARRAEIPRVLFVDSDSAPTEMFIEKECNLETILQRYNSHFIVSNEVEHWGRLVGGTHVYRKPLNSGVFLFDTSNKSEQLLRYWWLIATNLTTPYELQRARLRMTMLYQTNQSNPAWCRKSAVRPLPPATLQEKLQSAFGLSFAIHQSSLQEVSNASLEWTLEIEISIRQDFKKATAFRDVREACCGANKTCSGFLEPMDANWTCSNVSVACSAKPLSTFVTWPGEQDRLNWIVDAVFNETTIVTDLGVCDGGGFRRASVCLQHFCNSKGPYIGTKLFEYLTSPRVMEPELQNKTRDEWDFTIAPDWLARVWKVKTTTSAMESQAESRDDIFVFEEGR